MKKLLLCIGGTVLLLQLCLLIYGQNINFSIAPSGAAKKYTFSYIPPTDDSYPSCNTEQTSNPRASLFIEFGDGNFLTNTCSPEHIYPLNSAASMKVLLRATGIYDGGPRPKRVFTTIISGITSPGINNGFPVLASDSSIKITANHMQLISEEEAVFAITLKPSSAGELIFFYDDPAQSVFEEIDGATMLNATNNSGETVSFMAIRPYNNATVITTPSSAAAAEITAHASLFSKHILFSVPGQDGQRNIFITIPAKRGVELGSIAGVKAVFIPGSGPKRQAILNGMEAVASRDPNSIEVSPLCMRFRQQADSLLYTVHFQNLGSAPANNITIVVNLPEEALVGLSMPVSVFVRGRRFDQLPLGACDRGAFGYSTDPVTKTVKIKICGASLKGTLQSNAFLPETQGYVLIKVRVNPAYLGMGVGRTLEAKASIVFDTNSPIVTEPVFVALRQSCVPCKKKNYPKGCYSPEGKSKRKSKPKEKSKKEELVKD